MNEHEPSEPELLHASQDPVHEDVQQTPSTQNSMSMQSGLRAHGAPGGRSGTQKPNSQCAASMHCVSPVQLVGHVGGVWFAPPVQNTGS
jgi:hypothetical protein